MTCRQKGPGARLARCRLARFRLARAEILGFCTTSSVPTSSVQDVSCKNSKKLHDAPVHYASCVTLIQNRRLP
jgi:hypothetical protein